MDENEVIESTDMQSTDSPRARLNPYFILMRQSRLMGRVATRTYDVTKEFLKRDVATLNTSGAISAEETKKHQTELKKQNGLKDKFSKQKRKDDKQASDLKKLVHQSHQVLAYAKTVILPVNLFPDTICVDRTKVSIELRSFFWSSQIISVRIEDVLNVSVNYGPFFGSLLVSTRIMNSTDHYEISYLWRKDAINLKHIIQGYVIAQHNNIDVSHLSKDELTKTLKELGTDV